MPFRPVGSKLATPAVQSILSKYMDKQCSRLGSDTKQGKDAALKRDQRCDKNATASNEQAGASIVDRTRLATLAQIGEDWLYLALLGIIMAMLSFSMDIVITLFLNTRLWMFNDVSEDNLLVKYLGWCLTPIVLVTFSTGFVHLCSPTVSRIHKSSALNSGIN